MLALILLAMSLRASRSAVTLVEFACRAPGEGAVEIHGERYRETSYRCKAQGHTVIAALPGINPAMKMADGVEPDARIEYPSSRWVKTQRSLEDIDACAPFTIDRAYFGASDGSTLYVLTRVEAMVSAYLDGVPIPKAQLTTSTIHDDGLHELLWRIDFGCLQSFFTRDDGFGGRRQLSAWVVGPPPKRNQTQISASHLSLMMSISA